MTIEKMIFQAFDHGYNLKCGPHYGNMNGFYAVFFAADDDSGESLDSNFGWNQVSHGATLKDAITKAFSKVVRDK